MRLPALAFCLLFPLVASAESPESETNKIRISTETTRITRPLTKEGYVDYHAYLNDKRSNGVNPEQNAAVWYFRAMGKQSDMTPQFCRDAERLTGAKLFDESRPASINMTEFAQKKVNAGELSIVQEFYDLHSETTDHVWTAEEFPLVAEWLRANEKQLALVEKAGSMPQYYTPLVPSDILYASNLTGVQSYRSFARMLASRVLLRVGEGDFDAASRDLVSMYQLAAHTGQGNTLIEGLVGVAILSISEYTLQIAITTADFPEKQLASLQGKLEKIPAIYDCTRVMDEGERLSCLDAIQFASRSKPGATLKLLDYSAYEMGAAWDYRRAAKSAMYWVLIDSGIDWNVALEQTNQLYDEMVAAVELPVKTERDDALREITNELGRARRESESYSLLAVSFLIPESGDKRVSQFLMSTLAPAITQASEAWNRGEVRRRVSPLGCAVERYRRLKGKYPPTLNALVPSYIDELPIDPYTDQQFHYRVNSDRSQFAVFTFGPNGKDDNGASWGDSQGGQTDDMGMYSPDWLITP